MNLNIFLFRTGYVFRLKVFLTLNLCTFNLILREIYFLIILNNNLSVCLVDYFFYKKYQFARCFFNVNYFFKET